VQLIPELIITLIAGDQYLDTIPLLRFVVLFSLFTPFLYQTGITLESVGKPKINFYFTVISFFLNFLLNALFISQFGIVGAAYGTLVTYFIVFCAGQVMLKKLVGVQTGNIFRNIINFCFCFSFFLDHRICQRTNIFILLQTGSRLKFFKE